MVVWPKTLIRELADRRVLLFVGAGFSKTALPSMPTWPALIKSLSERLPIKKDQALVKRLIGQNSLLDAAQIISDGIERAELNAALRGTFQVQPPPYNDIYQSLLDIDLKTIVTTNYDEFLEKNFDHYSGGHKAYNICRHTSKDLLDHLRSPSRTIIKVHGCITQPTELVLDRTSYFKARQNNFGFFNVLSSLFTVNTVLFVGYSLGDPDMQIILESIHSASESSHGHYSLLPKQDHRSIVMAIKKTYNISCIEYPVGQHDSVPKSIRLLADSVKDLRLERGIV